MNKTTTKSRKKLMAEQVDPVQQIGRVPAWLGIAVVIGAIVIIVLLALGGKYPFSKQEQPTGPGAGETEETEQVFSYVGKITSIAQDKIELNALAVKNPSLEKDTGITVLIADQTKFIKVSIPNIPPQEMKQGEAGSLFTREEISLLDLNAGDEVTAISADDIKDKTKFTAKKIELIEQ